MFSGIFVVIHFHFRVTCSEVFKGCITKMYFIFNMSCSIKKKNATSVLCLKATLHDFLKI